MREKLKQEASEVASIFNKAISKIDAMIEEMVATGKSQMEYTPELLDPFLELKTHKLADLIARQDKYLDDLKAENEKYKTALEDIGYIKTWIAQNKPMELVKIALTALREQGD